MSWHTRATLNFRASAFSAKRRLGGGPGFLKRALEFGDVQRRCGGRRS
jgi:hypothetical protein